MIKILEDNRVFLDYGPIQMAIDCFVDGVKNSEISCVVANCVLAEFNRLTPFVNMLKEMRTFKEPNEKLPTVLNKMITGVAKTGYDELNTLGAVAGSFSEYGAEIGGSLGATKVIINNGGDIAIYNTEETPIKVGIPFKDGGKMVICIKKEDEICGICTSGMSGRSFSKGIATFVSVFADKASVADGCATYIANMTDCDDENIVRCFAEEIDEGTDIRGQVVTVKVGKLSKESKLKAVLNGYTVAEKLYNDGVIKGAVVCVDEIIMKIPEWLDISF